MHWVILFTACISGDPKFYDHFESIKCMQYPSLITYESQQDCVDRIEGSGPPPEGIDKSAKCVALTTLPTPH